MLDNKWKWGTVHFELPELAPILLSAPGIKPVAAVLDDRVGKEIVLLITERKNEVKEFEDIKLTKLMLKVGLVNTSYGPVCFLLFDFPNSRKGGQVTYENTVDPKNERQLSMYGQLSDQAYWHVVIADDTGDVVNFFEFANEYGLKETLVQVESVCEKMEVSDFTAAKAEYEAAYSIDRLMEM